MAVEIPPLFCLLLQALSILPQAPSSPQEETQGFSFGWVLFHHLFLLFLPRISIPLLGTHILIL